MNKYIITGSIKKKNATLIRHMGKENEYLYTNKSSSLLKYFISYLPVQALQASM